MAAKPPSATAATAPKSAPTSTAGTAISAPFLSSFYIYNPSLGQTDDTVHEQLVFTYSAKVTVDGPQSKTSTADAAVQAQDLDRQLRAIGLAQGIVQFARAFSPDAPLREVRTQGGFTVPLEVETGWWMLAVSPAAR